MGEDTESVMGGVRMGVNVDIKRTDGKNNYTYIPWCITSTPYIHSRRAFSYQDQHTQTTWINGSAGYNQSYVNW